MSVRPLGKKVNELKEEVVRKTPVWKEHLERFEEIVCLWDALVPSINAIEREFTLLWTDPILDLSEEEIKRLLGTIGNFVDWLHTSLYSLRDEAMAPTSKERLEASNKAERALVIAQQASQDIPEAARRTLYKLYQTDNLHNESPKALLGLQDAVEQILITLASYPLPLVL